MVLTTPMILTQTHGIKSVLLNYTHTRGPSVARMRDLFNFYILNPGCKIFAGLLLPGQIKNVTFLLLSLLSPGDCIFCPYPSGPTHSQCCTIAMQSLYDNPMRHNNYSMYKPRIAECNQQNRGVLEALEIIWIHLNYNIISTLKA